MTPPKSVDVNIFAMTAQEKEEAGIASMPANLKEALGELKNNPLALQTMGSHIFEKYYTIKEAEWDRFRTSVTDWELASYLKIY